MMYGSWDMERNRQDFLSFWTDFCPFTPYGPRKSKFLKYQEKTGRYYHFTNVYHKRQSYDVLFLRYGLQRTESFAFFALLPPPPPNNTKNQQFQKMKKKPGNIIILHMWTKNDNHVIYGSWDIERDGQIFCNFGPFYALLPP